MMRSCLLLLPALLAAGCDRRPADDRPLAVSVIGRPPAIADPSRMTIDAPTAALLGATAQGLVGFDAAGQVQHGLAERWIVADQGRSFIFRLRGARWTGGPTIDAAAVARDLHAIANPRSRNPLKPLLGAIDDIEAVTPQVVEIDLVSPRPNLLQLLAQPEAALLHGGAGAGPMAAERAGDATLLRTLPDPDADPAVPPPRSVVRLRGERAALAVARFMAGAADTVLGGSFADLAIARAAAPLPQALRFDPVRGLFGLAFADAGGDAGNPIADPAVRSALSQAVDRDRIAALFAAPGFTAQTAIVPAGTSDLAASALPDWAAIPVGERRATARATIAAWTVGHGTPRALRVAMPEGPGARMLFVLVRQDWRAIGFDAVAVAPGAAADLRLIDRVAPSDSASFYLRRFACIEQVPCAPDAEAALDAARIAPTLAERAEDLATADRALLTVTPFIAIAQPLRWSLVDAAADGWRESPRGLHPLATLRATTR